ncbi:MAG: HAMP domain-containing histidine kinase [Acidimicrobiia bacterium]|nr:HAMP domain-containing histidine kinase [Acidimicrobiia bacterium]
MWRTIRVRITALATVVVVVVLGVAAVALLTVQRRLLVDNLDEALSAHGADLAAVATGGDLAAPLPPRGDDDSIAQVTADQGEVLAATANFADRPPLPPPPGDAERWTRSARLLPGEPEYRIRSQRVGDLVIHTASPLDDIEESVAALRIGLAFAIPIVAVALALLVWRSVGRTLAPVEAIRREVADISEANLDRRVPEPGTGDEVERLARTMNAMLDRLEQAVERQRRFVADASHELRSPLTRIRSELEVDLGHPDTADHPATHRSVLEETEHLQRLVEDLLVLARHDAEQGAARPRASVDLDDVVLREASLLRATAPVEVDVSRVSAAQVDGRPDELARVVRNLTDNAIRHARTTVTLTLSEATGRARLTVSDDGPGIPPDQHDRVFERFARVDDARSRVDGGTGLGLAIAREIVERHGGTIVLDPRHTPGARFVVELPLADGRL